MFFIFYFIKQQQVSHTMRNMYFIHILTGIIIVAIWFQVAKSPSVCEP